MRVRVPLLMLVLGLALAACGNDDSGGAATSSAAPEPVSYGTIPLGQTARVPVPADAEMVILVPAAWRDTASALRCTVVDTTTGVQIALRPASESAAPQVDSAWVAVWAISAGPTSNLEVGCQDPESKIPAGSGNAIRVEPRGVYPIPGGSAPGQPGTMTVTGDFDGKEVSLVPGQTLEVSLAANPTTGYQWELVALDQTILAQVGEPEFRPAAESGNVVGAGGNSIWRFVAEAPGGTELRMGYARPWEQGSEPAEGFTLKVAVGH
ncbi:protease inhibitor I42 family protein [Nocardia thraciensis]